MVQKILEGIVKSVITPSRPRRLQYKPKDTFEARYDDSQRRALVPDRRKLADRPVRINRAISDFDTRLEPLQPANAGALPARHDVGPAQRQQRNDPPAPQYMSSL